MVMHVNAGDKDVLLMSLKGLVSQNNQEDVVVQGSGLSRGDKRRNAKVAWLRELVPAGNAILGIDWPMRSRRSYWRIMIRRCWRAWG